jgi:hypothetical protein
MSSEAELLQGALDLIVLRPLDTMGPQHAYSLAARLEQVTTHRLTLNQGTLYPAIVRLEQRGWIKGRWGRTENNREAKFTSAQFLYKGSNAIRIIALCLSPPSSAATATAAGSVKPTLTGRGRTTSAQVWANVTGETFSPDIRYYS